jgi:protein CpxP
MNRSRHTLQRLLLAATLALPLVAPPLMAQSADAPPPPRDGMRHARPAPMCDHMGRGEHMGRGGEMGGPGETPPFLRGLDLSEVQRDKVFAILHAQAPLMHEQHKQAEKTHQALHALALADQFDDSKAAALAQQGAQAMAKGMLQHLRTEHQILALLTPEQRQQIERREADGPRHPPRPQ